MKRYSPLLLLLVLLGALAVSQVATAASAARPDATFAHPTLRDDAEDEEEFVAEDGEFEFEECEALAEEIEFEDEEEEFEEEEFESSCGGAEEAGNAASKGVPFVTAPAACQVRQAESTITTLPAADQLRLTIHYRTYAPTEVTVGLKLKDQKGSVAIEHATKHLGDKGVLRFTTSLGGAVMDRALAASEFDVSLRASETPGFCAGALEQRLHSVKHQHTSARAPRVYAD
ncbi:MAG TPA: hypothetical protein VHZ54_02735 [Solirubrobacterales bacterium]|nr:hypothetical protein [Solirubrobacterales bacterium]